MRRSAAAVLTAATLALVAGVLTAVTIVPSSAYVLPSFEFTSKDGPVRLTAEQLGARRTDAGLQIDQDRFSAAIASLQERFRQPPLPGSYELKADNTILLTDPHPGWELDPVAMRGMLLKAFRGSRSNLKLPIREIGADEAPANAIVVNLSRFRLDLYQGSELTRHYTVGVGALRFPTPPGAYYVRSKAKNPTWRNPGSGWARSMPAYIPPGPRNPLGTRALRLDRGALVIHGTPQPWTVGTRSSHGCIRMKREDVEELYELVPENTPVFIVP